jgi:hypothetical protein
LAQGHYDLGEPEIYCDRVALGRTDHFPSADNENRFFSLSATTCNKISRVKQAPAV